MVEIKKDSVKIPAVTKMTVIKRDRREVPFDRKKIEIAIEKAMKTYVVKEKVAEKISENIECFYKDNKIQSIVINDIERKVIDELIRLGETNTALAYESYRAVREYQRLENTTDNKVIEIIKGSDKEIRDNSNKNPALISTMRDLVAEVISKDISLRHIFPPNIVQSHNEGIIYIHDLGHWLNPSINCCLINLWDMLMNGTVINGRLIEKPKSFRTACTIATQIIAQVASGQFGGQTISIAHLAPFVRISKERISKEIQDEWDARGFNYTLKDVIESTKTKLQNEVSQGIQTFLYQINTLQTSNGQAPFLSLFMHTNEIPEYENETVMLIEEVLKQRIQGMKNKVGAWTTPAFPKLLYVTDENNIHDNSTYYWLTKLAAKSVAKRMSPDFISAKEMRKNYEDNVFGCMGCRAFLSPYTGSINNTEGNYKWYGRFNMGLTSINLADVGLSARKDEAKMWEILDNRLELCKKTLMLRYDKLKDVTSDVSPIHWQYGAIARLKEHEKILPLLQNGYATISLGYVGLYECVKAMLGVSHTTPEGEKLALKIMHHLKDTVLKWKEETGLGFALYGTPAESLTERFATLTRKRWGVIEGITDKNFLTNSYHVFVEEQIDAFEKLKFESQFHSISSGGAISYIEVPNMSKNIDAVLTLIKYMYENVQYAEINTKLDYCMECGYDGEIMCGDDLVWRCPNCSNTDTNRMNIVRRTCGYLGENLWCNGRTEEIKNRVLHI